MKSLFWKKLDIKPRLTNAPKTEEGLSLTYMIDKNKYIHFGGFSSSTSAEPKEGDKEIGSPSMMSSPLKSPGSKTTMKSPTSPSGSSLLFSQTKPKLAECSVVYIFDPADNTWTVQKCRDKLPPKRLYHHSWYEAPNFFIYGGISSDKKILFDIWVLNTDTWTWRKFFSLDGPLARLHSAFIDLGPKKYLVGGASYPENLVLNDVWSLSFDNVTWKSQFDLPGLEWEKLELKEGQLPNIKAHAAIRLTDNLMFIFGGYDQKGECTATSLLLDTERLRVTHFETKGKKPGPRAFHKMIAVKENIICLFGGVSSHEDNFKANTPWLLNEFYLLNISEGYWSTPNVGGYIPSARCYFAMSTNENEYYNQILVLGGKTFEKEEEAMYILSELRNDDSDAWGVVYDKDKEKERKFVLEMTSNRFGIPSSARQMEKKQIGELEAIVKNYKNTNDGLEQRRNELKKRFTDLKKNYDEEIKVMETTKEEKTKRNNQNNELNDRLKVLLAYEKKKRRLAEVKSLALQASMRKSENFIITIDSFYNKCLKDNLLTGMIKEDILNKIELHKTQHKETLMKFKDEYEHIFTEEKNSRTELKAKKKMLKQQMDLSGAYKAILSKDDEKYLNVTKKT